MAWLTSSSGRRYYYRRRRVDGRVISEYVGGGRYGALAAQLDEAEQKATVAARKAWRRAKAEEDVLDKQVDELVALAKDVVTAALLVSGYHQHKRAWRKQR